MASGVAVQNIPGKAPTPKNPAPPKTTVINGKTYIQDTASHPLPGYVHSAGTVFGSDGSAWSPMANPAPAPAAAPTAVSRPPSPGPSAPMAGPAAEPEKVPDIDFTGLWSKTGMIPPPPTAPLPPRQTGPGLEDRRRSESLQFGRAKDRIGQIGSGAMKALRNELASRGMSGGGAERAGESEIINGARGDLADVVTNQAMTALEREAQISDRDYAGGINQRGQDIGYNDNVADRTMAATNQRLSLMNVLLNLSRGGAKIY